MLGLHRLPDRPGRAHPRIVPPPHRGAVAAQQGDPGREQAARGGAVAAAMSGLFLAALLAVTLAWWSVEADCQRPGLATFSATCAEQTGPGVADDAVRSQ